MRLDHVFMALAFAGLTGSMVGCSSSRESRDRASVTNATTAVPTMTAAGPTPPRAALLSSAPTISMSGELVSVLANRALPLKIETQAGQSETWLTDVVYCGSSGADGWLVGLICGGAACTQREPVLGRTDCATRGGRVAPREVRRISASGSPGRIELRLASSAGENGTISLPPIEFGDLVVPVHSKDRDFEARLRPSGVAFRDEFVDLFYRIPPTGFGSPSPPSSHVTMGWSDEKLSRVAGDDGVPGPVAYLTLPVTALSELIGDRIVRRYASQSQGILVFSHAYGESFTVVTHLRELSFSPVDATELAALASVMNRLEAPGSNLSIDLPAAVRVRVVQDGDMLALKEFEIDDRRDYSCRSSDAACQSLSSRVKSLATSAYQGVTEQARNRPRRLFERGRKVEFPLQYATRTWRQQLRVSGVLLQGTGGQHVAIALEGDVQ